VPHLDAPLRHRWGRCAHLLEVRSNPGVSGLLAAAQVREMIHLDASRFDPGCVVSDRPDMTA
jgi:hypothetical protein